MENLIFYLLKTALWIAVFWLIYRLFLRKETFFGFNRIFLLAGLILPFGFAFIQYRYQVYTPIQITYNQEDIGQNQILSAAADGGAWLLPAIFAVYAAGAIILLLYNILGISRLARMCKAGGASFSFFGRVFVGGESGLQAKEREIIVEHEEAHSRQRHWCDILLAQAVCMMQWFNPFAWLMFRSVKQNHEFLADRAVIDSGCNPVEYQAVLVNSAFGVPVFSFANSFSNNKLNRVTMMKKNVSRPAKKLAVLLLAPAMASFLWAFAKPEYNVSVTASVSEINSMDGDTIRTITVVKVDNKTKQRSDNDSITAVAVSSKKITLNGKVKSVDVIADTDSAKFEPSAEKKGDIIVLRSGDTAKKPLILLDGEPLDNDKLSEVNPAEIESLTVLKDASATKVYGDSGKDGVILITTKKAAGKKAQ
jgi:TonB-dependent SusC/RagA subfamily outer membrane receptor